MILTGRGVSGDEARVMGLANRLTPKGEALAVARELAHQIAAFPQGCMYADGRALKLQEGACSRTGRTN